MEYTCFDCPRNCGAIRTESENTGGVCKMPYFPKIARADLHFWEEPCISGTNGSGTIFFSGCSLGCVYCQNYEISHGGSGKIITAARLAEIMRELEERKAHNINFVNPTHYFSAIKDALKIYRPGIPLVYNSGGYDKKENIEEDIFDIYLMDLKYVSPEKSLKYSFAKDYFEYAAAAIKAAYLLKGEPIMDKNGIMQSGLIIRHLVLPLSTKETLAVIDFVKENTPNAYLSLMAQYMPCCKAENFKEINRKITAREYEKVVDYCINSGLKNVFIQERSSSDKNYVPDFNIK